MRLNAIEDIEEAIVSWVIHNGEHFHIVAEKLVPDDFSQSSLGPIWRCFNWLASNEKSITPETVSYRLEQINAASSLKALPNLSTPTNDGSAIRTYVELVHKESQRRRLAQTLKRYASVVEQTPDINLDALLHELDGEIHTTKQHHAEQEPTLEEAVKKVLEAQERFLDGEEPETVSLGLPGLNAVTGGGRAKDYVIVAGRPSHGKTLLAIRSALENSLLKKSPTLLFSLEMGRDKMINRCLATLSGIPFRLITEPSDEEFKAHGISRQHFNSAVNEAARKLMAAPLHIDDRSENPDKYPSALLKSAKRWHAHFGGLGQIIIDYIQLTDHEPYMINASPERHINHASKSFKSMAKSLNTNVMALSQLNRNLEAREDKRPILSDLRGSGSIEEDGDIIMFVYQDRLYNPNTVIPNTLEIGIGKNRDGPLERVLADLDLSTSSIINLTPEEAAERLKRYEASLKRRSPSKKQ
ncbi:MULTISPECIES: replicative DNA helicase [Halomonas]|uniref:replicative DNA helicase n=1 Tax=Halomonas TaxID=2745 RepID=UPI003CEF18F5